MKSLSNNSAQAMIWLSVKETASLLGIRRQSVTEACRERNGKHKRGVFEYKKDQGNGGEQYLIKFTSLPEECQVEYCVKNRPDLTPSNIQITPSIEKAEANYNQLWEEFDRKPEKIKNKAKFWLEILNNLDTLTSPAGSNFTQEKAIDLLSSQFESGLKRSTILRKKQRVKDIPKNYWLPFLADDYKGREKTEIYKPIWDYFQYQYLTQAQPPASVIYNEVKRMCAGGYWGDVELPSLKTFQRRIQTDIEQNTLIAGREGKTALKNHLPHIKNDYTSLGIHEEWQSDGHIDDLLVIWPGGQIRRPHVVFWYESRTRKVLSFVIHDRFNTATTIESFELALRRTGTFPKRIKIDNGREYANKAFTGGQKNRFRFRLDENEVNGLTSNLGIEVGFATPGHGQAKSIERLFNTLNNLVPKRFPGAYVGKDTVSRPEDCNPNNAIPLDLYRDFLNQQIEHYHSLQHRGRGMNMQSPNQAYELLMKAYQATPPTDHQLKLCRPYAKRLKLNRQNAFCFKIPLYGEVTYEVSSRLNLKRQEYYDVYVSEANPKEPAIIYQNGRYIGDAEFAAVTHYLDKNAAQVVTKKRGDLTRRASQQLKTIRQDAEKDIRSYPAELTLLPQAGKVKSPKQLETIQTELTIRGNAVIDNNTGEVKQALIPLDQQFKSKDSKADSRNYEPAQKMPSWVQK